jgi:hypothetical protein
MLAEAMIFLVMLVPNTETPVMALMMSFPTMKECRAVLDNAPKEQKGKFQCIRMDINPKSEGESA